MKRTLLAVLLSSAALSAGCFEFLNYSSTKPETTVNILGGDWTSVTADATSLINSCTNFVWNVTESTPTTGAGFFTAKCFDLLDVSGSAKGTLSGMTASWTASAIANGPGVTDCPINLTGTAALSADGSQIQIPYTGNTCMGPVTGMEILKKK